MQVKPDDREVFKHGLRMITWIAQISQRFFFQLVVYAYLACDSLKLSHITSELAQGAYQHPTCIEIQQ